MRQYNTWSDLIKTAKNQKQNAISRHNQFHNK